MSRIRSFRRRLPALAALVALLPGCGISLESMPKLGSAAGPGYDLHATFTDVLNLAQGAQIRDGDALVGRVTSLSTTDYLARLTLHIDRNVHLPVGTTASVEFNTPLGDEFVQLQPPTSPPTRYLTAGATLAPPQTTSAPSVEDLLAALAAVLYGGGLSQAHTVVVEMNQILGASTPQLRQVLSQLTVTLGSLSANAGNLDDALTAVARVSAELSSGGAQITRALDTLPGAAQSLSRNNQALQQLLDSLNNLSPVVVDVVQQSGTNLVADAQQLVPVVQQLVSADQEIGPALSGGDGFLANVAKVIPNGFAQINSDLEGVVPKGYPSEMPNVLPPPQQLYQQITTGAALQELLQEVLP